MNQCSHTLCFRLKCNCDEQDCSPAPQPTGDTNLDNIYTKFASTLEVQLRKQHEQFTSEIDELNNQVFGLKNTILRLELRNKRDIDGNAELRRQYNLLLLKAKDSQPRAVKEMEIVERIREVTVEVPSEQSKGEMRLWKKKAEENSIECHRAKMERDLLSEELGSLKDEIGKLNRSISKLEGEMEDKRKTAEERDRVVERLNQQIVFLKNNKQVVIQTKYMFPQFKSAEKVRTETKVEIVYIEKPVQKLVFVDVERRVKQFIQPERAIVNRVITCPPSNPCHCQDEDGYSARGERAEANQFNSYIDQLQGNITSYKAEREQLVDVIGNKNSQLNFMEAKMRLYGGSEGPARTSTNSAVNVVVRRIQQAKPTSQKGQTRNDKYVAKK